METLEVSVKDIKKLIQDVAIIKSILVYATEDDETDERCMDESE